MPNQNGRLESCQSPSEAGWQHVAGTLFPGASPPADAATTMPCSSGRSARAICNYGLQGRAARCCQLRAASPR